MEQIIREIIREKIKNVFKEAKQVGTVYHFTTPENFEDIIRTNVLIGFGDVSYRSDYGPRKNTGHHAGGRRITLTRNKNFHKSKNFHNLGLATGNSSLGDKATVRISLDGDKLSQIYKIVPFRYFYDVPRGQEELSFVADESEERVIAKNIKDISKYITAVDDVSGSTPVPMSWNKTI